MHNKTDYNKSHDEKLYLDTMRYFHLFLKEAIMIKDLSELEDINQQLVDLLNKLKENPEIMQRISRRLKFILVESFYSKIALLCKYFLKEYFNVYKLSFKIDVDKKNYEMITCYLKYFPSLFDDKCKIGGLKLKDIISLEPRLKENGVLLSQYNSIYQYNMLITLKYVKQLSRNRLRILLTDQLFLWLPNYFDLHHKTMTYLIDENGYIPNLYCIYIAIMAVSTIRSEYLLRTLEEIFILQGGDESWIINGLKSVPEKIQNISKLNNIIAHQPWKLDLTLLTELYKFENINSSSKWNFNELVHACLIMVKFHKLASIYQSLGFNLSCNKTQHYDNNENIVNVSEKQNVQKIYSNLEIEEFDESKMFDIYNELNKEENKSIETKFEIIENSIFDKHISNYCTAYRDFDYFQEHTLSYIVRYSLIEEFNWTDQGYDILKKFNSQGVDNLNDEIEYIMNLTSNSIGQEQIKLKTIPMKLAFCKYIERLYGYTQNDYNYSQVNVFLTINHKTFFKNLMCFQNNITPSLIDLLKVTFSTEEILHVTLIACSVKIRLQLTYLSERIYRLWKTLN